MTRLILFIALALPLSAQQRFQFHPSRMQADWIYDRHLHGEWQRVTGPLPAAVLKQLIYEDGYWWVFTKRVSDQTGLSWQNRQILRDGDWINLDVKGNITVDLAK